MDLRTGWQTMESMYFQESAIHDQKPLRFAYEMEWNFDKTEKSSSETLGVHDVFALEFQVAFLL